jgi:hypothetical protein
MLHKEFAQPLHVVLIAQTNVRPQARAHVVLFSSDLALAYAPLVDYDSLRFQIEFNFRDAKQYWGLEDFMHVTPTGVTHAANLSLFMVNVADRLRADGHGRDPDYSVLDLKADYRGYKYVEETIQMLPEIRLPAWAVFMPLNPPSAFPNWRRYCNFVSNVHPWKRSNPLILKEKLESCSDYMGFLPLFQELTIPRSSSKSRRNWRFIDTFSRVKQKK